MPEWVIEALPGPDGVANFGDSCQIAVDVLGRVHVAGLDFDTMSIYHTILTGISCDWEKATGVEGGAYYVSMAVDPNGFAHIAYQANTGGTWYATNKTGSWVSEQIDSINHTISTYAIAVDSAGRPHLIYEVRFTAGGLPYVRHAWKTEEGWQTEEIAQHYLSNGSAIAIDSNDSLHVVHVNDPVGVQPNLLYGTNKSGSWVFEEIHAAPVGAYTATLACVPNSDQLQIVYDDTFTGKLYHVQGKYGLWSGPVVVDAPSGGIESSGAGLGLTVYDGRAYLAYTAFGAQEIRYATNAGGEWAVTTLREELYSWSADITTDAAGGVHAVFFHWTDDYPELLYAYLAGDGGLKLRDILTDVSLRVGLSSNPDFDYSAAIQPVDGFVIGSRDSARNIIAPLLQAYFCDLAEVDGQITAVNRGAASVADLPAGDLGAHVWGTNPPPSLEISRVQDVELPKRVDFGYFSKDNLYDQATQGAVRQAIETTDEQISVNTPVVMGDDSARRTAEALLYDAWVKRTAFRVHLPPKWLKLSPGDVVTIPTPVGSKRARVVRDELAPFGPVLIEAVADDPSVISQGVMGWSPGRTGPPLYGLGDSQCVVWHGNALLDAHAESVGLYVMAAGDRADWAGCVVYLSFDGGASYQEVEILADPAIVGYAETELAAGLTTGLWDESNTVDVALIRGSLTSRSEAEVLAGENACILGDEVIQFATATPLGDGRFRLSKLLRGRRGTDAFWSTHSSDERFGLLAPGWVKRIELSDSAINKTLLMKAVPVGRTLADVEAVPIEIQGREYMCYSPVGIHGIRDGDDLTISWIRRSRKDFELRDYVDIALGEIEEAYEVDVMDGESVVRTLESTSQSAEYTAAQQTTDFGSPQSEVDVRVYQIGRYGRRGYPGEATV